MNEIRLDILERFGNRDSQELVAEIRNLRQVLQEKVLHFNNEYTEAWVLIDKLLLWVQPLYSADLRLLLNEIEEKRKFHD